MKQFAFPKPEHLCLRLDIEKLFAAGSHSMTAYPLRVVYREVDYTSGPKVKVLLSVSKRRFKHAVDRNRAKRQLREAYRLNKHLLMTALPEDKGLHIAFLWLSDRPVASRQIHSRLANLLTRVAEKLCPVGQNETVVEETK